MRRFYIPPQNLLRTPVSLANPEARHIQKVLRLQVGAPVCLFDGSGAEYAAAIERLLPDRVDFKVLQRLEVSLESPLSLVVAQGFLKDKKMDGLLRAMTELGVAEWLPFYSQNTVPVVEADRLPARVARWQSIACQALKQCRRNQAPVIRMPCSFETVLTLEGDFDHKVICWENETRTIWPQLAADANTPRLLLVLGPEGGFSSNEVTAAHRHGFVSVSLGPRILRAETAAVTACAIIQHRYGDLS